MEVARDNALWALSWRLQAAMPSLLSICTSTFILTERAAFGPHILDFNK
jgi:hypothetical protein